MDKDNYFLKMIIRVLEDGIYLGEISSSEEYLNGIVEMFNSHSDVFCRYEHKMIIIEDPMCNPIMSLAIRNNTLYLIPAGEDNFFSCFVKIIEHVSNVHKRKKEKKKQIDENAFEWI